MNFHPTATLRNLQARAYLLAELRAYFHLHQYWETQTPVLSQDCCVDAWIDPFQIDLKSGKTVYLQTSPEFAMKRLLLAGADRIFEVARVFRQEECGPRHNPEFTMVEWYACNTDHHDQMDFVESLVRTVKVAADRWKDIPETESPPKILRLTYADAFLKFAGVCPLTASNAELADRARRMTDPLPSGIEVDRDGLLNLILADQVEPGLKQLGAVFLYDYPASQAALARIREGTPSVAERFELYLDGIEICNGYHELTDPVEQLARMEQQNHKRVAAGKSPIPDDSLLIQAMRSQRLPECSGVALGFDRLVMWALGLDSIDQVVAFPFARA
jgi:lysyl-tRNA synthetase class 2